MKIILPVAGKGTRLRPHTYTRAKSLVTVAGKTVLEHILDNLLELNYEKEFIFITDENGEQIKNFVKEKYPDLKTHFTVQKERLGPAHAVWLAKDFINEEDDILIVFNDTMFITDLNRIIEETKELDGLIFSKEVDDPRRFGVNVVKDGIIVDMVEKPDKFVSNLAQVGLYYIKNGKKLMDAIEYTIKKNIKTKGEFYLPSAFLYMIKNGAKFGAPKIDYWLDCGTKEALLNTNRFLLKKHDNSSEISSKNSLIIPPNFIDPSAIIENSIIGPFVSIGKGVKIKNSIIKSSIINNFAEIDTINISNSIIGENAFVKGNEKSINIGDDCVIKI